MGLHLVRLWRALNLITVFVLITTMSMKQSTLPAFLSTNSGILCTGVKSVIIWFLASRHASMLYIGQTIYLYMHLLNFLHIAFPTIYYKYDGVCIISMDIYIDHFVTHIFMVFSNIDAFANLVEIKTKNFKQKTFGIASINVA